MRAHTPQGSGGGTGANPRQPPAGVNGAGAYSRSNSSGFRSRTGPARPTTITQASSRARLTTTAARTTTTPSAAHPRTPQRPASRVGGADGTADAASPSQAAASLVPSSSRAVSHDSGKENMAPPDAGAYELQRRRVEALKAEVGTLRYTARTQEQERDMARLQHEAELRDARRAAATDFEQRQAAEAAAAAATRAVAALEAERDALRADLDQHQSAHDERLRAARDAAAALQTQLDEALAARDDAVRAAAREAADHAARIAAADCQLQALRDEAQSRDTALADARAQLADQALAAGRLEADVLRLKACTGDAATMDVIRRELRDQVGHIRALEAANREQLAELRRLRHAHKAVEIVEEEKRALMRRLDAAQRLEVELDEERRQRQRLETEHRAWAAYLQPAGENDDPEMAEFDSPAAVARALMEARLRTAELTEKLGTLQPELAQRDADLRTLQAQNQDMAAELARLRTAGTAPSMTPTTTAATDAKARARLERQRTLAVKEVEYLRAQLQALDAEDLTFRPDQVDQHKADRIRELEVLVDQYRAEAAGLHEQLSAGEAAAAAAVSTDGAGTTGVKRPHPDDDDASASNSTPTPSDDQIGQLTRKTRRLQDELAAAHTAHRVLETELAVTREQLAAEKTAAGVRVLALRSNPTDDHAAVQRATLKALQQENAELLAHIQAHTEAHGRSSSAPSAGTFTTVPLSVLAAAQREIADAQADTVSAHKTSRRLKEVWASKSAEFKEAVESTLGWHVTFIPNGKMRVESIYHPSRTDENENSIVFDGERGTMKVGGGPRSAFAQRIDDQIRFWVRDKGCIPGFLAALTLEFCEEQARTAVPGA